MRCTAQPAPGKHLVYELLLEDAFWRYGHPHIVACKSLPKEFGSQTEAEMWFREREAQGAKRYLLRQLTRQSLPSSEVSKKLQEREVSPSVIEQLIAECAHLGLIDDDAWVAGFVRGCLGRKMGARAIGQKLRMKGIPSDKIASALTEHVSESHQKEGIRRLLATRYRSRDLTQYKERQKVIAALLRKGYSMELIIKILGQFEN